MSEADRLKAKYAAMDGKAKSEAARLAAKYGRGHSPAAIKGDGRLPTNGPSEEDDMSVTAPEKQGKHADNAKTEAPKAEAEAPKAEKAKRPYVFTPYEACKVLNAKFVELNIIDPKTDAVKEVGSPAMYIALRADRFKAHRAQVDIDAGMKNPRWEVERETFDAYMEEYLTGLQKRIDKANGVTAEVEDSTSEDPEADDASVETDEDADDDDEDEDEAE